MGNNMNGKKRYRGSEYMKNWLATFFKIFKKCCEMGFMFFYLLNICYWGAVFAFKQE